MAHHAMCDRSLLVVKQYEQQTTAVHEDSICCVFVDDKQCQTNHQWFIHLL